MKQVIVRCWSRIGKVNGLLFIAYSIFIFAVPAVVLIDSNLITRKVFHALLIRKVFYAVLLSLTLCPLILGYLKSIRFDLLFENQRSTRDKQWIGICFMVPFIYFLFHYIVYYPGAFSPDSISQYGQAITNDYNDWHPVLQTLFTFKLPLVFTDGWIGSIVLFQILVFSLVLAYSLCAIRKHTNEKYVILAMLFILLNPQTGNIAMFPWKDVSFAIGALLLMTYAMQIYFSHGLWMKKPWNATLFVIVLAAVTLFRHNAILFTVPLLVAVLFSLSRKRAMVVIFSFLFLVVGVKYPLFSLLNVKSPGNRQVETLGLPMTVIGAAVANSPDALDEETKEFAYKVAPKEVWECKYTYGSYNSVKWDKDTNNEVIEEYGVWKVISMMLQCFRNAPGVSLRGLIQLTDVVYTVTDNYILWDYPSIAWNDYGISSKGIPLIQTINHIYTMICCVFFPHLFMYIGAMHLVLCGSILAKLRLNVFHDWERIFFIIPLLAYNFGTSLLLTGAEDSSRFFYYTYLIMPILLIIIYKGRSTEIYAKQEYAINEQI